jgi:hypothetical protein|tara:strand:+ start:2010 stop:2606 length:597 start_codon:yes stop_codon:yes gene_type:complete
MSSEESSDETIEPISPVSVPIKETKKKKSKKTLDKLHTEIVEKQEIEVKKKPKGRPPKSIEEKLAKQVIVKEKIIYMVQNEKGDYEKAKNPKITVKELKKIELNKHKEQKEIELGKTLQTRKNGKIDNRSAKVRTPAQIEATRKLVESNKKRREEKTEHKEKQDKTILKETVKDSVREVVNEPFYEPKKKVETSKIRF